MMKVSRPSDCRADKLLITRQMCGYCYLRSSYIVDVNLLGLENHEFGKNVVLPASEAHLKHSNALLLQVDNMHDRCYLLHNNTAVEFSQTFYKY